MLKKCLLITTNDNRNLFTHQKNLPQLIEFSKVMGAEISIVTADNPDILSLEELAPAICNSHYKPHTSFKILKRQHTKKLQFIKSATRIRQYIRECFLRKEVVELQSIVRKFNKLHLTPACFCNHLSRVRKELQQEGYKIEKISGGKYRIKD